VRLSIGTGEKLIRQSELEGPNRPLHDRELRNGSRLVDVLVVEPVAFPPTASETIQVELELLR
jgi:hypothetical protein